MHQIEFYYHPIFRTEEQVPPPTSLICGEYSTGPTRTVLWHPASRTWRFDRKGGTMFLFDEEYQPRTSTVSRTEAERLAREVFGTTLPSEAELHRICDEGETALKSR
jgi:hypothetical protein